MPKKIEYKINETKGREIEVPCINCAGKTTHKIMQSAEIHGSDGDQYNSVEWTTHYQIIQCLGCKSISFREAASNSEDYRYIGDGEFEYEITETLYPPRIDGIKGLGDDAYYLPPTIRRIYEETLQAISIESPVLAAIGLRALLETVCKEKNATGNNLLIKIDNLVTAGILTPASAAILHKIRTLGNAAAHEVKPHSDKQLALAMDIVEHLLKDVYILPKQVESEFDDDST